MQTRLPEGGAAGCSMEEAGRVTFEVVRENVVYVFLRKSQYVFFSVVGSLRQRNPVAG